MPYPYKTVLLALAGLVLLLAAGCSNPARQETTAGSGAAGMEIRWRDKGLERMLREYLDKPSGVIYRSELADIQSMHIVGTDIRRPGESEESFAARLQSRGEQGRQSGDNQRRLIYSLDDLVHFSGLTQLILEKGRAEDISALAALTGLTELELRDYLIRDITPLAGLKNLTRLSLNGNYKELAGLEPLSFLPHLRELDLGNCGFSSPNPLAPLAAVPNLTKLNLAGCKIDDLTPLRELAGLRELDLSTEIPNGSLAPLAGLNNLETPAGQKRPGQRSGASGRFNRADHPGPEEQ